MIYTNKDCKAAEYFTYYEHSTHLLQVKVFSLMPEIYKAKFETTLDV